jgi:hypothetical protein
MRIPTRARIIGFGLTPPGKSGKNYISSSINKYVGKKASELIQEALHQAIKKSQVSIKALDGLVAVPSLAEPRFMEAHYIGNIFSACYSLLTLSSHSNSNWFVASKECSCSNN